MAPSRFTMVGAALLTLLVLVAVVALVGRPRPAEPPAAQSRPTPVPESTTAPAAEPTRAPRVSRSKGQTDWTFFFRAGDTLSRMSDGATLGVVVRLERTHSFPDGSTGPAYVVRFADQREAIFDADELERSARVEAIRDHGRPATGKPAR